MRINRAILALVALLAMFSPALTFAQDNGKNDDIGTSPLNWSVEAILDRYVSHITRYYDLNGDQEAYTRQLLTQRVKRFLKDYEKDTRSLFAEYLYLQQNRQTPSAEVARDWASRAGPLMNAIRKEIIDGNMQWREILNEKQLTKHDRDLATMNDQFDRFEGQMDRWQKGNVLPSDFRDTGEPAPVVSRNHEDIWEFRVRTFIQDYNLDALQRESAFSTLREFKDKAVRHRENNKAELDSIKAQLEELSQSAPRTTPEEIQAAKDKRQKLDDRLREIYKPIREDLFKEMMAELERIPREDQRRAYQIHREKIEARFGGKKTTTRPASDTQPAATQPAEAG